MASYDTSDLSTMPAKTVWNPDASAIPGTLNVPGSGLSSSDIIKSMLGGGAAGLLNQPANTTTSGSGSGTQNASGFTSTQRTLTPYQQQLQSPLFDYIRKLMLDPTSVIAPFQTAARNQVNQNYSGLADSLRQKFLSTSGGGSGKFGMALAGGETARLGALSDVDTQFQQTAAQLPMTASNLAEQLLGMNFGSTSSTSSSGSYNNRNQSQEQQNNGNPVLTGLGTAAKLLASFI